MPGAEIRSAAEADRPAIREVTFAAYDEYRVSMPPEGWRMYAANISSTLDSVDPAHCILAVEKGRVVGSVLLTPANAQTYGSEAAHVAAYPEVRLLAVAPTERGHGVGQALMDECARRARAMGATHLSLHSFQSMKAALRMYERMGFQRTPETDFRPAPDWLVMGFRLSLT
jgi:GNAT superfamily N-acetyltransferase